MFEIILCVGKNRIDKTVTVQRKVGMCVSVTVELEASVTTGV